jgi:pimeloyl-ACP methyl ester carboxylesterase
MASADSVIVQTSVGPVEYGTRGEGPVILHFHGGNVGHNGWFFLEHLILAGYQALTPDRSGYLGTPIDNGGSPEQQADLAAALLDGLGIERVAVVGISAGGPGAIQFAARHASRVDALVLLSAISQRTSLSDEQTGSALGRLVMTPRFQNLAYFLIHQAMTHFTAWSLQDYVRTETTYDNATGKRFIDKITADPRQMRHVMLLADAMVPAMPRFPGVMNDLKVQQELGELPFEQVRAPTLIVGSRYDGDIGYQNSLNSTPAFRARRSSQSNSSATSSGGAMPMSQGTSSVGSRTSWHGTSGSLDIADSTPTRARACHRNQDDPDLRSMCIS